MSRASLNNKAKQTGGLVAFTFYLGFIVAMEMALVLLFWMQLVRARGLVRETVSDPRRSILMAYELGEQINLQRELLRGALAAAMADDLVALETSLSSLEACIKESRELMLALRRACSTPEGQLIVRDLELRHADFGESRTHFLALMRSGRAKDAAGLLQKDLQLHQCSHLLAINKIIEFQHSNMSRSDENSFSEAQRVSGPAIGSVSTAMVLSKMRAWWTFSGHHSRSLGAARQSPKPIKGLKSISEERGEQ